MNEFPQALRDWFAVNEESLRACGVIGDLQRSPEDGRSKSSAWLTVETGDHVALLTVWSSGEAELDYGSLDSGRTHQEHRDFRSQEELLDSIQTVLGWVGTRAPTNGGRPTAQAASTRTTRHRQGSRRRHHV
ncbi:hypothetical protein [Streptomyces sp. NPDC059134]|uniref:hypothetical protein n=1 Tax=Streptomyces sp. NPDC059134 TaxID=3346738 RepID=UPI003699E83A